MRQWGVNNLHKVVAQQRHGRKSAYRLATAPPRHYLGSDSVVSVVRCRAFVTILGV